MASLVFSIINRLAILLWVTSVIYGNTSDSTLVCMPSIRVPRNTMWKAPVMKTLKINCTIETDSQCGANSINNLSVSWCRINDANDCKPLNHSSNTETAQRNITDQKHMSFLIFLSLSIQDAGLYRCRLHQPETISHTINVTVTDSDTGFEVVNNENKTTNGSQSTSPDVEWLWAYVYICSGILGLVLLVIAVPLLIIRCQRAKQLGKKMTGNQSSASQLPHFTSPVRDTGSHGNTHSLPAQLSPPSDIIYDNAPIRASSIRDGPHTRLPVGHTARPGRRCERFNVEVKEEESPLVYASLNHKAMPRGPVRVSPPEETSEYAAIRVS